MLQSVRSFFRKHTLSGCLILAALLILSVVCAVGIGPVFIPFRTVWRVILNRQFGLGEIADIDENTRNIIWTLRTPRVLEDALIGMSLTLSGISMQAFTRNPLASPYVLGISSGSYLGAVVAMTTSVFSVLGSYRTEAGAFCGAMFSIITVYLMAKTGTDVAPIRLVLVGMAASALFSAVGNYIVYVNPDETKVRNASFWMLGSLASAEWEDLIPPAVVLPPAFICLMTLTRSMNAMMMGESSAVTLGMNTNRDRNLIIFVSAVLTGTAVAVAGCIGFIGLIIPHIVRSIVGADHRKVLPLSVLVGGMFLIWSDVVARMVHAPSEIPIGIITAMIGAPFFLWMVRSSKYTFGS